MPRPWLADELFDLSRSAGVQRSGDLKHGLMAAALATLLTPFGAEAQDGAKKLPPPLKD
jgi:hypothetical protein